MNKIFLSAILGLLASLLFYQYMPGFNVLIAQILLSAMVLPWHYRQLQRVAWYCWGIATLVSVLVVLHGGFITSLVWFSACLLWLVQVYYPQASLLSSFIHAAFSAISAPLQWLEKKEDQPRKFSWESIGATLISAILVLGFILYFSFNNILFSQILEKIPFPEFSIPAIRFWLIASFIIAGMATPRLIWAIQQAEDFWKLQRSQSVIPSYFQMAAWVLFVGLNLVIFTINFTDLYYLTVAGIPEEVSYSQFLHQSINASITSVVFAILLVLTMYWLGMNNSEQFSLIKKLLYVWILQNVFLCSISLYKNLLYVTEYGLTDKRIGVFVYLISCIAGLVLTFAMTWKKYNVWYLFRANTWSVSLVIVAVQFFSWDYAIAKFNLDYAHTKDREYLLTLKGEGLALVLEDVLLHPENYSQSQRDYLASKVEHQLEREIHWLEWTWSKNSIWETYRRYSDLQSTVQHNEGIYLNQ